VAALTIVAHHSIGNVFGFLPGGSLGVDIFFVLSGFLITALLLEERKRNGRVDYLAFYMRRALRLLPALFLVSLLAVCISSIWGTPEQREITQGQLLPSIFYFENWHSMFAQQWGGAFHRGYLDPNWSLSIEEQFYVIWPITLAFLVRFNRVRLAMALAFVALLEAWWGTWLGAHAGADGLRVAFGTDTRTGGLLLGAAVALLRFEGKLPRPSRATVWSATAVLVLLVWEAPLTLPGQVLVGSACAAVLVAWVATGGEFLLSTKPVVLAGTVSYGIYLWNGPLLVPGFDTAGRSVPVVGLLAVLTIAAAAVMYVLWEKPFLKMQKRWRRSTLPVGQPAEAEASAQGNR
jgi:peptidoglycan/LPS O-acetylase OafA/YrhL